jgi:hypothetical protein
VRGRACTEVLARTPRKGRYAASVAQQWAVTEGPGKDGAGGATFRPGRGAKFPNPGSLGAVGKFPAAAFQVGVLRLPIWSDTVTGGLACTQWSFTLTGESPTPSPVRSSRSGVRQTHKHGEKVWSRGGMALGPDRRRFRDISCSKVSEGSPSAKGASVEEGRR